jgi:hypothetical protein
MNCYQWVLEDHPYHQTCPIHHPCQRSVWSSWTICCQSNTLKKIHIYSWACQGFWYSCVFCHPKHIIGSTFQPSIRTYSGLIYFCRCKPLYKSEAKLSQRSILGPLLFHMNTFNLPTNINSVATPVHHADTRISDWTRQGIVHNYQTTPFIINTRFIASLKILYKH